MSRRQIEHRGYQQHEALSLYSNLNLGSCHRGCSAARQGGGCVLGIIKDRITKPDCQLGFILDGFPRTLEQSKALDAMLAESGERVGKVLEFQAPGGRAASSRQM